MIRGTESILENGKIVWDRQKPFSTGGKGRQRRMRSVIEHIPLSNTRHYTILFMREVMIMELKTKE